MSEIKHKLEHFIDKVIPYSLLVLLVIIILELGHFQIAVKYHKVIEAIDWIVIVIFALDLYFKYLRIKKFSTFLKKSWLDILAIFPFFLLFRVYEELSLLFRFSAGELKEGQMVIHEVVELEKAAPKFTKEGTRIVREVEEAGMVARSYRFSRFVRPLTRIPRFLKAIPFYEKPSHRLFKKRK